MAITVDDLGPVDHAERAITTARAGLARAGACRSGYIPDVDSRGIDNTQAEITPNSETVWTEVEI